MSADIRKYRYLRFGLSGTCPSSSLLPIFSGCLIPSARVNMTDTDHIECNIVFSLFLLILCTRGLSTHESYSAIAATRSYPEPSRFTAPWDTRPTLLTKNPKERGKKRCFKRVTCLTVTFSCWSHGLFSPSLTGLPNQEDPSPPTLQDFLPHRQVGSFFCFCYLIVVSSLYRHSSSITSILAEYHQILLFRTSGDDSRL